MHRPTPKSPSGSQQGGITILVALVLLALMSIAAFAFSRNTLRDAITSGYTGQGIKAGEAADAGLDWFMVWGHPNNQPSATTPARTLLTQTMAKMQVERLPVHPSRPWDIAKDITSTDSGTADDMAFDTAGAKVKQNSATGNETRQAFDVFLRFVGESEYGAGGATESSEATGGKGQKKGTRDLRWQAVSTGRASVGGGLLVHQSRREIITLQSPRQITLP